MPKPNGALASRFAFKCTAICAHVYRNPRERSFFINRSLAPTTNIRARMDALLAYFLANGLSGLHAEPLRRRTTERTADGQGTLAAGESRFSRVTQVLGKGGEGVVLATTLYDFDSGVLPVLPGYELEHRAIKLVQRWYNTNAPAWTDTPRPWPMIREIAMSMAVSALQPNAALSPTVTAEQRLMGEMVARAERWFIATPDTDVADIGALMPEGDVRDSVRRVWLVRHDVKGYSKYSMAEAAARWQTNVGVSLVRQPLLVSVQPHAGEETLHEVMNKHCKTTPKASNLRRCIRVVACALAWLNAAPRGFVHGDLSPGNVMAVPHHGPRADAVLDAHLTQAYHRPIGNVFRWRDMPVMTIPGVVDPMPFTVTLIDLSRAHMPALSTLLPASVPAPFTRAVSAPFYGRSRAADLRRFGLYMCITAVQNYRGAEGMITADDGVRVARLRAELSVMFVRLASDLLTVPASWITRETALLACDASAEMLYRPASATFGEFLMRLAHVVLFLSHVSALIAGTETRFARAPELPSAADINSYAVDYILFDLAPYTDMVTRRLPAGVHDSDDDLCVPERVARWEILRTQ